MLDSTVTFSHLAREELEEKTRANCNLIEQMASVCAGHVDEVGKLRSEIALLKSTIARQRKSLTKYQNATDIAEIIKAIRVVRISKRKRK